MNEGRSDAKPQADLPGTVVKEAMEAAGWTQIDLAFVLGVTTATVNQILSGKRGISGNNAKALGAALNIAPEKLARVQAEWNIQQANDPAPIVLSRARVLAHYPLRDMIKRGWIADSQEPVSLEQGICRFFDAPALDQVPRLAHAAKKTDYGEATASQLAWLFRVRQIAKEMVAPTYSSNKLETAIARLSEARNEPEGVRHVPRLLHDAGVRFVVVECLPGSKIDGVCFWLDDKSPVIGMSLRFDRIDNFWFVLRHECAHVLHRHGRLDIIIDSELEKSPSNDVSNEEIIANDEAAEFCVSQKLIRSFYLRKQPLFSDRDVVAFAKKIRAHPGLVVGQLQRMTNRYDLLRQHLVKVRDRLSMAMMMDGWGDIIPVDQ